MPPSALARRKRGSPADEGKKSHECLACTKEMAAAQRLRLQRYLRTRAGQTKPYECSVCPRAFKKDGFLRRHLRDMHPVKGKRYKCAECRRKFYIELDLEAHLFAHLRARSRNDCGLCHEHPRSRGQLATHLRAVHGVDGEAAPLWASESASYSEDRECSEESQDEKSRSESYISAEGSSDGDDSHRQLKTGKRVPLKEVKNKNKQDSHKEPSHERSRGRRRKKPHSTDTDVLEHSSDEDNDYEKLREKNIRERMELIKSLGIADMKTELKETPKKNSVKPETFKKLVSPRKSKRQRGIAEDIWPLEALAQLPEFSSRKKATCKSYGPVPMLSRKIAKVKVTDEDGTSDAASICADFMSLLKPFLFHRAEESQFSTCSLDMFKTTVSGFALTEDMAVNTNVNRITSMAVHPGKDKVIIASGDGCGYLALWDVCNTDKEKCLEVLDPHKLQVSCTSFDQFDPTKVITASSDGTVRRGDLIKLVFEKLWDIDDPHPQTISSQATWHDQADPHSIMVAHGSGRVVVVDTRDTIKPVGWFECHEHYAVTVHKHPLDNKFFLTSSWDGQVRLWDWRMMDQENPEPVWNLEHPKSLTSAFFSCEGNFLLTTCSDDLLRVYDTALLCGSSEPKAVVTNILHRICSSGHSLKSMWHPKREDVFLVGSMDKKLVIYGIDGLPVHSLTSQHLVTIPAVYAWHPTLPLIAGANHTGRVHVFK